MKRPRVMAIAMLWPAVLAALVLTDPAAADMGKTFDAYKRGDYATAFKEYRQLAEQGDAAAQFMLGWMYEKGEGVEQDNAKAVQWYRLAAKQGDAAAQYNLGWM